MTTRIARDESSIVGLLTHTWNNTSDIWEVLVEAMGDCGAGVNSFHISFTSRDIPVFYSTVPFHH